MSNEKTKLEENNLPINGFIKTSERGLRKLQYDDQRG